MSPACHPQPPVGMTSLRQRFGTHSNQVTVPSALWSGTSAGRVRVPGPHEIPAEPPASLPRCVTTPAGPGARYKRS
jgi:hypothetical protein